MDDGLELYKKYRPGVLSGLIGQDEAVATLKDLGRRGAIPHCLLMTGPSGTGKTTAALILRRKLKCSDHDFAEINAAKERGIEMVRSISQRMGLAPMGGPCRVWLIDECHQLSADAQGGLLKMLEDTPRHVYFILATTDPQKLREAIRTRSTEIKFKALDTAALRQLVGDVAAAEGKLLEDDLIDKIAEAADGSARKALVHLHAVIGIKDPDEQRAAVAAGDYKSESINLARALFRHGAGWADVVKLLKGLEDDAEQVRRHVLGYARTILLGGGKGAARAEVVIDEFRDNFYDSGAAGLALACRRVIAG